MTIYHIKCSVRKHFTKYRGFSLRYWADSKILSQLQDIIETIHCRLFVISTISCSFFLKDRLPFHCLGRHD